MTLILDITVEREKDEVNKLFEKPEIKTAIEEGKLNVVMWKSYQKYASLGTGKIMSGNITVINNGSDKFTKANDFIKGASESLQAEKFPENQLMMHILKTAGDSEIDLVKHATKNSNFVVKNCFESSGVSNEGLPFLMLENKNITFNSNKKDFIDVLYKLGVEPRESFSFMLSSCLMAGITHARVNFGHESEATLIEKFHTLGQIYKADSKVVTVDSILDNIKTIPIAKKGGETEKETFEREFQNNINASNLNFALTMFEKPEDKEKIFSKLGDFIKGGMTNVTKETKSKLVTSYFEFIANNPTKLTDFEKNVDKKALLEKISLIPSRTKELLFDKVKGTDNSLKTALSKFKSSDGLLELV